MRQCIKRTRSCVNFLPTRELTPGLSDVLLFNQSPKGIMRSAVPLPCFFDVMKSHRVAGQRPRPEGEGMSRICLKFDCKWCQTENCFKNFVK